MTRAVLITVPAIRRGDCSADRYQWGSGYKRSSEASKHLDASPLEWLIALDCGQDELCGSENVTVGLHEPEHTAAIADHEVVA